MMWEQHDPSFGGSSTHQAHPSCAGGADLLFFFARSSSGRTKSKLELPLCSSARAVPFQRCQQCSAFHSFYVGRSERSNCVIGACFVVNVDPFDIHQGSVGDCWLLSAISALWRFKILVAPKRLPGTPIRHRSIRSNANKEPRLWFFL